MTDERLVTMWEEQSRSGSEPANGLWELVTPQLAFESPCGLAIRRGSTCGLDRIVGRAEFVRGDVCDGHGLAGGVRGMPCFAYATQVSVRAHRKGLPPARL